MKDFANPEILAKMGIGERLINSLMVTVLGMGITFMVLIILYLVIKLIGSILYSRSSKKAKETVIKEEVLEVEEEYIESDDSEIVAIITAAITAYEGVGKKLKIKSVRRLDPSLSSWSRLGVEDTINRNFGG